MAQEDGLSDSGVPHQENGLVDFDTSVAIPITPRSKAEVSRFLDGLQIVDPGVVPLGHWQPSPASPVTRPGLPTYCALGRKP